MMAVEVDQRRAGQRRGLDADPEQAEMLAHCHQRHRRQEQQQTAREDGLRLVAEKLMFFAVEMPRMALPAEIADTVDCRGQEQDAHDTQEEKSDLVQCEPPAPRRLGPFGPGACGQRGVEQRGAHQQARRTRSDRNQKAANPLTRGTRKKAKIIGHQSLSDVNWSTSIWSNSRLIWKIMIPMTKTATNTSSKTPISTRNGSSWAKATPKMNTPFSSTR